MTKPKLDPDAAARVAAFGDVPPMHQRGLASVRAAIESAPLPDKMPEMASIIDTAIPGPAGPLAVRIYCPTNDSARPVLVYFHGGGLVMGSNHSFEPLARALASGAGAKVVAVDYRLAPEAPPPAQFDDAFAATEWFSDSAELKKNMEGSDDLTIEKAIDMMVDDVNARGIKLDVPSKPLHDPAFITALNAAYDFGGPSGYPEDAPISAFQLA
jgi:hypothetical protein